ncbi:aldo/keto reductase [Corynebacterium breve]|uniref:Aldo/keto reductase n=1 Tax=Corynebacterium breve TaxID=3049799 RepID=A0ABY8VKU8_9CORY|nr:aldo/keto reductase [Corynebacterium breve]WIM68853.1 aldo/keto reductase [Corynebacterium breve]
MKQRNVGHSGLRISPLGLSTAGWTVEKARDILSEFVSLGGCFVDIAPGTAHVLAAAIEEIGREKLVLSAPVGVDMSLPVGSRVNCSRTNLLAELDHLLNALGTDYVDVLSAGYWDARTPPDEVAGTVQSVVASGRARYGGAHGYAGWQLAVTPGLVVTHNDYSLLRRDIEEEVIPAAQHLGVGVIAAAPLAHGLLTGNWQPNRPETHPYAGEKSRTIVEALVTAADGLGLSPTATSLAWVFAQPGVDGVVCEVDSVGHLHELMKVPEIILPRPIASALDDVSK